MPADCTVILHRRRRALVRDGNGRRCWKVLEEEVRVSARELAVIVCDMWDRHWSRGARERVAAMAPRMNEALRAAREKGVLIVHAPSDTIKFYEDSPARRRVLEVPPLEPPRPLPHDDPPLPVDATGGGSDTDFGDEKPDDPVWTRQIESIEIDEARDCICDDGREIYGLMRSRGIGHPVIAGVHTNMCVLNRSFGIKAMVRWGVDAMLCRDLTDALYDPARPPYVGHDEGTRLVVEYIEKFWCPTISSQDLTG